MIPKIIHYCWFGGKPLPKSAIKCINSWKKFFPDYEIKEWNERNFDVNLIPYTKEAYAAKKYAFVSDFARFWVLHEYGGIYFDTDVEVIRNMKEILSMGAFMGFEKRTNIEQHKHYINPGLGMSSAKSNIFFKEIIDIYSNFSGFSLGKGTVCEITSLHLIKKGAKLSGGFETIEEINLLPADYLCPQAMIGAPIILTENTHSIHHFDCTWLPLWKRKAVIIKQKLKSLFENP